MTVSLSAEYVAARAVLLDALAALDTQASAVVLVGAQAVYLRAGGGDLAVAPMTTDADLAVNIDWVRDEPELYALLLGAGFRADTQPGTWRGRHGVCVDLMVVPHQSGRTGRSARAARLPPHQKGIARIARGLEPALVDHTVMSVGALDDRDGRAFDVRVAGPSALLVAKLIKIGERLQMAGTGGRSRVQAKDALDLLRLLRATRTSDLVEGLERHRADRYAAEVSVEALSLLRQHGVRATAALPRLASESVGGDPTTSASFVALAGQLLSSVPQPEGK